MRISLDELPINEKAVIVHVGGEGAIKKHLLDMGIISGTEVFVKRTAPFGDPIEISIRGLGLSLRKADAKKVLVDKIHI